MKLPWWVDVRCALAGFLVLRRRVGFLRALYYGLIAQAGGDPFKSLPPPGGLPETLSRRQIAPAVGLYKVLKSRLGPDTAAAVMRSVVTTATQAFLSWAIGRPDASAFQSLPENERRDFALAIAGKFFNASGALGEVSGESFSYTVERCLFVELCAGAGVPELAPLFCEGDLRYFATGPVGLDRTVTLASDGRPCDFRFSLRAPASGTGAGKA
jgi:hypothetical protein